MQTNLVIWSYNRACQLETLLNSIRTYCPKFNWTILYSFSSWEFRNAYEILRSEYKEFNWRIKDNGKRDLIESISNSDYSGVVTDDCVFHSHVSDIDMSDIFCFSLRLGYNTIIQNCFDGSTQPELIGNETDKYVTWNFDWYHPLLNYGYPFSTDGHIYHTKQFVSLLNQIAFNKPTELESNLFYLQNQILFRGMRAFKNSVLVNVPLTNMSGVTESIKLSIDELNKIYRNGFRLRFKSQEIKGCHQVLPYEFNYVGH